MGTLVSREVLFQSVLVFPGQGKCIQIILNLLLTLVNLYICYRLFQFIRSQSQRAKREHVCPLLRDIGVHCLD